MYCRTVASLFQVAIHHGCQFEICNWCNKVLYSEFMSSGMEKGIKYSQDQSSILGIMLAPGLIFGILRYSIMMLKINENAAVARSGDFLVPWNAPFSHPWFGWGGGELMWRDTGKRDIEEAKWRRASTSFASQKNVRKKKSNNTLLIVWVGLSLV